VGISRSSPIEVCCPFPQESVVESRGLSLEFGGAMEREKGELSGASQRLCREVDEVDSELADRRV